MRNEKSCAICGKKLTPFSTSMMKLDGKKVCDSCYRKQVAPATVFQPISKTSKSTNQKGAFYKRAGWVIAIFILFPPIGIYLFLKYLDKPNKTARIIISIVYGAIWLFAGIANILDGYRYAEVDGQTVKITCGSYCSQLENVSNDNVFEYLARAGIIKIDTMRMDGNNAVIGLENGRKAIIAVENNQVSKIYDSEYTDVTYYSADMSEQLAIYPAESEISSAKIAAEAEKAKQEKEEAKKQAEEEQAKAEQAAEDAKYPSADGAISLCEEQFHKNYPYSGSKVHSILGVIASGKYTDYTYLYKVNVTIQNAFGATRDTVMECVVEKSGDYIRIKSFYIY